MKNAAVIAGTLLSLATYAHADGEARTTTADTLVVVTPNAPVIVTNGQGSTAPGATENPPAPVAAPNGAPITDNWNDVSHINGSIVPVGERNNYLYKFKRANIQSDPVAWMFGFYQVSGSYALSQNIALSLEVSGWSYNNGNTSGYQVAASLPIYLKRVYSGPFIEPGLVVHSDNNYYSDCYDCSYASNTQMTRTWTGPEMMIGYSWLFDSGLNMSAAVGASKRLSDNTGESNDDPDFAGYFRVGYAF